MDNHWFRALDPDQAYKPLDFGNGRIAGSVAPDGRLLSLSTYHAEHGYITLSSLPPFRDEKRFDQDAVRAYRSRLADRLAPAIGLVPAKPWTGMTTALVLDVIPQSHLTGEDLRATVTTWAPILEKRRAPLAIQDWQIENISDRGIDWSFHWEGALVLARASMTQLTEGGVIPMPPADVEVRFDGQRLSIHNPALQASLVVSGLPSSAPFDRSGDRIQVEIPGRLHIKSGEKIQFSLTYTYNTRRQQTDRQTGNWTGIDLQGARKERGQGLAEIWRAIDRSLPQEAQHLARRAIMYTRNCCALPVDEGICLLTDHQILPLSWTRDAYYMAAALLAQPVPEHLDLVRRHLTWLFEKAQRPEGYWGRAYLPNGKPKDRAFQLDQQCYPLLELADYYEVTADEDALRELGPKIPRVLEVILDRAAGHANLFTTEETPADDPLTLPYHFSSHVLLWHTLRRLAGLNQRISFTSLELEPLAQAIHSDVQRYFIAEKDGQRMFAYAANLAGERRFYHDANDLPTVLAPVWGFCDAHDPVWRATMDFAFTPANRGGYYPGVYGGLGSVHTPGAWPLGDVQEWIYARLTGDSERASIVLSRLNRTSCWDGGLPEARDPDSGEVRSRHWFAWPNCALLYALCHPAVQKIN